MPKWSCVSHVVAGVCAALAIACGQAPSEDRTSIAPTSDTHATSGSSDLTVTADERKSAEDFYSRKTLSIVVGSGAGGGFDSTARLVSRHIARHIPGNPTVIVVNMPGGGGLVAANHMFNAAPKDGSVIGVFHEAQVMNQLTGEEGVQFDLRKFNWLGSSYVDPNVCLVRTDASATTMQDIIHSVRPIAVGGTGPGSNTYDAPRVVAAATGANLKAVAGYPTTNDVRVGVERGELQGMCLGWETVQSSAGQWLEDKYAKVFVQNGTTRHPDLPDVPLALDFAKNEESKAMLRLVDAPGAMSKPFALPPDADQSRVRILRAALAETYRDPDFLAEAKVMHLHFHPKTPDEIQQVLNDVLSTPPEIAAKYRHIIEP